MQDKYVSLDPEYADAQIANDRWNLYQRRLREAKGGQTAHAIGMVTGATAMFWFYQTFTATSSFALTPFRMTKLPAYGILLAAGYIGYGLGNAFVGGHLGDLKQAKYLQKNRGSILKGSMPMDNEMAA